MSVDGIKRLICPRCTSTTGWLEPQNPGDAPRCKCGWGNPWDFSTALLRSMSDKIDADILNPSSLDIGCGVRAPSLDIRFYGTSDRTYTPPLDPSTAVARMSYGPPRSLAADDLTRATLDVQDRIVAAQDQLRRLSRDNDEARGAIARWVARHPERPATWRRALGAVAGFVRRDWEQTDATRAFCASATCGGSAFSASVLYALAYTSGLLPW